MDRLHNTAGNPYLLWTSHTITAHRIGDPYRYLGKGTASEKSLPEPLLNRTASGNWKGSSFTAHKKPFSIGKGTEEEGPITTQRGHGTASAKVLSQHTGTPYLYIAISNAACRVSKNNIILRTNCSFKVTLQF